jgi:Zn-dependent peptidase ImmA (M78 family)
MSALAKAEAIKIIEYYGITKPEQINLEIISAGFGVFVEEKEIDGSEGRITHNGKRGIIVVDSKIIYQAQKRFIIAHELGHFRLSNQSKLFSCDQGSFLNWQQKFSNESEANIFAAELLMPEKMFKRFTTKKMISFDLIKDISNFFETSITSSAFRYAEIGNHPVALIYCVDSKVKWAKINEHFTHQFIQYGMKISQNSYTFEFFNGKATPITPEEVPTDAWFMESFNYQPNSFIYEQCFGFPNFNAVLVLLWEK